MEKKYEIKAYKFSPNSDVCYSYKERITPEEFKNALLDSKRLELIATYVGEKFRIGKAVSNGDFSKIIDMKNKIDPKVQKRVKITNNLFMGYEVKVERHEGKGLPVIVRFDDFSEVAQELMDEKKQG